MVCREIAIPYYPKVNEVVHVKSAHLHPSEQVHHDTHIFEGHKLQAVSGSCHYSVLSRMCVKVSDALCSVPYWLNARCAYTDDCDQSNDYCQLDILALLIT